MVWASICGSNASNGYGSAGSSCATEMLLVGSGSRCVDWVQRTTRRRKEKGEGRTERRPQPLFSFLLSLFSVSLEAPLHSQPDLPRLSIKQRRLVVIEQRRPPRLEL